MRRGDLLSGSVWSGVVALVAVAAIGSLAVWKAPSWLPERAERWRTGRLAAATSGLRASLGALPAALAVALAGAGLILFAMWPVGKLAHVMEPHFDVPLFEWFQSRQVGGTWSEVWRTLTNIGALDLTQRLTALAAVVFAVLFARRRWWVPPLVLGGGYLMEKFLQQALKVVVDRGHPPTTLGSYPSGGCARVIVVYGLIVFFALRWARVRSYRVWVLGASLVALAATVQAYARTYNLEHWFSDVLGGLLFGVLLLATLVIAALTAQPVEELRAAPAPRERRSDVETQDGGERQPLAR
jgi:membrane-associated phospholipid phosphatase